MADASVNPYLPGASATAEPARHGARASKALAVLAAVLCVYLPIGVGFYLLGHRRRFVGALTLSVLGMVLFDVAVFAGWPKLFMLTFWGLVVVTIVVVIGILATRPAEPRPAPGRAVLILLLAFFLSISLQLANRVWLAEPFQLPSGAMIPTLQIGDHIMVSKLHRHPGRGEVVVFKFPPDPAVDYVKRVVAVAGDLVEVRQSELWINGAPLPLHPTDQTCPERDRPPVGGCGVFLEGDSPHRLMLRLPPRSTFPATRVPAGHLFVMGDNRDNSNDSRVWGPVPVENVKGRVQFIWASKVGGKMVWSRLGVVQ